MEVGQRLPFPFMKPTLDLKHHDVSAPPILQGSPEIPLPQNAVLQPIQENHMMAPWQWCSNLLHYLLLRPRFGKRSHILHIVVGNSV